MTHQYKTCPKCGSKETFGHVHPSFFEEIYLGTLRCGCGKCGHFWDITRGKTHPLKFGKQVALRIA